MVLAIVFIFHSTIASELQAPTTNIPDTYFGLHIHHLIIMDQAIPTPWPDVAVPAWRLWDAGVNWPDLEPAKGVWQFGTLDRYLAFAEQHGTKILLPLEGSPGWASARPQSPSPYGPGFTAWPDNLDDWRVYVKTVVARYKGRIEAYEIWNEPNLRDFWTGNTDQMIALTKEASQIIHSIDPRAIVVSPSATTESGVPWLAEFLKKGGGSFVDVIGFHLYVNPHTKTPEDMIPLIQSVQRTMTENGAGNLPLWNTESGWLIPAHFDSEDDAAGFLARAYILAWACGVQRFYWYAWDNRLLAIVTYSESEHRPTKAGLAYGAIQQWLVGARMDRCSSDGDQDWVCQINRSGKKEWIVWNPQGSRKFNLPKEWHVKSSLLLLGDRQSLSGLSIEIGPQPMLLAGHS